LIVRDKSEQKLGKIHKNTPPNESMLSTSEIVESLSNNDGDPEDNA